MDRSTKKEQSMIESKKSTKRLVYAYENAGDYRRVDASFLSQLEASVERYVIPAIDEAQRVKESRAQHGKRLRVD